MPASTCRRRRSSARAARRADGPPPRRSGGEDRSRWAKLGAMATGSDTPTVDEEGAHEHPGEGEPVGGHEGDDGRFFRPRRSGQSRHARGLGLPRHWGAPAQCKFTDGEPPWKCRSVFYRGEAEALRPPVRPLAKNEPRKRSLGHRAINLSSPSYLFGTKLAVCQMLLTAVG